MPSPRLRIGVDVGGTNTDGVLLDPSPESAAHKGILAWHKSPTTPNPSKGIETVIKTLLQSSNIEVASIASVTIGTTHFINAVIEKDRTRLARVAVIRLCGPFSRDVHPGIDWPTDLRDLICAYCGYVSGGIEVDGEVIGDIDEGEVAKECRKIKELGIKAVVVNGVFSPADVVQRQEERVGEWVKKYLPGADVVLSKEVANLGFIERENASILNAAILPYARKTIHAFQSATKRLALTCPVFLTQNDGTILQAHVAARLPIRTFSSGPTNSMCGAAFLVNGAKANSDTKDDAEGGSEGDSEEGWGRGKGESMLVVDIGGTTTDVGMLLPSGLPRNAGGVTQISGVRMNFACPDVASIGLGGGSLVRKPSPSSPLTIGPDSVGSNIHRALVFGGDTATATDYAVLSSNVTEIGTPSLAAASIPRAQIAEYRVVVKRMLEGIIDRMKTSAEGIPVLLVGGGAILASDDLAGASRVVKVEYAGVANAIGAAIARVSGTLDTVVSTLDRSTQAILAEVSAVAVDRAVANGALRTTVVIAEMDAIPLPYVANKCRVIVKAIGDFDYVSRSASVLSASDTTLYDQPGPASEGEEAVNLFRTPPLSTTPTPPQPVETKPNGITNNTANDIDVTSYNPHITPTREWLISELDLAWISCGCYILGTGGGGNPYSSYIKVREMLRGGAVIRVKSPEDLKDEDVVACGGMKGSPTVVMEKLAANEMMEAQEIVYDHVGHRPDAVIALEIGGMNGLQGLLLGASTNMNIPTVDGDWMGRAYPVAWQITPVVMGGDKAQFLPTVIADGNGNTMVMLSATSEKMIERAFRAALSEMGSSVACAKGPCSGKKAKSYVIEHTISLAWRIGRAVALCRLRNDIDNVAEAIIEEVGGNESARVLFKGKIVGVERKTVKGHVYGEVVISASDVSGSGNRSEEAFKGTLRIPFKNENIMATAVDDDGIETPVASVPDLICVCDASSGEAIGTPEYRYGLLVIVIGIQASEKWTFTARGIDIGGPRAFGMDVDYHPLGTFSKPRSVIDEYWRGNM